MAPGLMKPETAARYCDMSRAEFLRAVASGCLPNPVRINGKEFWRKIDEATGVGKMQADYMSKFAVWVTDAYWGGPEYICPAIESAMRGDA